MHNINSLPDLRLSYNCAKIIKNRYTEKGAHGSAGYVIDLRGNISKKPRKKIEKEISPWDGLDQKSSEVLNQGKKIEYTEEEQKNPHFRCPEPTPEQLNSFRKHCKNSKKETEVQKKRSYKIPGSKVRKKIMTWAETKKSRKMLYFWTVTFPEKLNDSLCYKYFQNWLTRLRTKLHLKSYLWVVERQQNGTIHFHIIVNQIINVIEANRFMRVTLCNGHKKGEFRYKWEVLCKFNGVDIAKNSSKSINSKTGKAVFTRCKKPLNFAQKGKKKALAKYLTKYITKNQTEFERLVWYCSKDISNLFTELAITEGAYKYLYKYFVSEDGEIMEFENEYIKGNILLKDPPDDIRRFLWMINESLLTKYFN